MEVLRAKTVEQSVRDADDAERGLRRSLGSVQLTAIGIGVIIGTGIFVLTGEAAGTLAGPAITLSFAAAAIACFLAALCYASSPRSCRPRARPTRSPTPAWAS